MTFSHLMIVFVTQLTNSNPVYVHVAFIRLWLSFQLLKTFPVADLHFHSSSWLMLLCADCEFPFVFSLHLTTMCLQYKPTIVACVCIHLASKWSEYEVRDWHLCVLEFELHLPLLFYDRYWYASYIPLGRLSKKMIRWPGRSRSHSMN